MKSAAYIQIILSYICLAFVFLYYQVIDKGHTGPMDWWGIVLVILSIINVFIGLHFLAKNEGKETKLQTVLRHTASLPAYLLILPIILLWALVYIPFALLQSEYVLSRPLRKKGFRYKSKQKPYAVLLTRENVVIRFAYETYQISFDGGETFLNIVDSHLGTTGERNILRAKMEEYIYSSSLSRQKGDVAEPTHDFIVFLNQHL